MGNSAGVERRDKLCSDSTGRVRVRPLSRGQRRPAGSHLRTCHSACRANIQGRSTAAVVPALVGRSLHRELGIRRQYEGELCIYVLDRRLAGRREKIAVGENRGSPTNSTRSGKRAAKDRDTSRFVRANFALTKRPFLCRRRKTSRPAVRGLTCAVMVVTAPGVTTSAARESDTCEVTPVTPGIAGRSAGVRLIRRGARPGVAGPGCRGPPPDRRSSPRRYPGTPTRRPPDPTRAPPDRSRPGPR